MKYIKTFEDMESNFKYWKIPIDNYFFPKLSKINVPKWEQKSCHKHYLTLLKEKNPVKFIFVFQDPYSNSGFNESFNPNSDQKLQDEGYIKQDDIELTAEEKFAWDLRKDIKKYNI